MLAFLRGVVISRSGEVASTCRVKIVEALELPAASFTVAFTGYVVSPRVWSRLVGIVAVHPLERAPLVVIVPVTFWPFNVRTTELTPEALSFTVPATVISFTLFVYWAPLVVELRVGDSVSMFKLKKLAESFHVFDACALVSLIEFA